MPKSKEPRDESDTEDFKTSKQTSSASDEETPKASATKKAKTKHSSGQDDPPAKRAKPDENAENDAPPSSVGPNGERLYEIGKLRYVSVSQFKGKPYVNIREYYDDNGVSKPGRKGISLAADQWDKLKELFGQIDKDLKKAK